MNTALIIIGLAMFIFIIVFTLKRAKDKKQAQQEEHQKIKEYGESINEETRNKNKWIKFMNKWKRFQRKIKFKGKTYNSVYEACNKLKFSYSLALSRLAKGESIKNVFHKGKLSPKTKEVIVDSKKYRSLEEARRELNPEENSRTVQGRFKRGMPIKVALGLTKFDRKDREKIKFRGKTYQSLSALARAYGISVDLFIRRIKSPSYKHKFSIAEALGLEKIKGKGFTKSLIVKGKKFPSIASASEYYQINHNVIRERLSKNWTIEQAFELEKRRDHHPGKIGIIYLIVNKKNKMKYIGASLTTLAKRWKMHLEKSVLKKAKRGSIAESINKYGPKNFSKKIIKRAKNISELSRLERHFIKKYKSKTPNGYNLSSGGIGYGVLGKKLSIDGKKFNSVKEASKYFKVKYSKVINRVISGWSIKEALEIEKRSYIPKGYHQIEIDGLKFNTIREACAYFNLPESTVRNRIFNGWSAEKALKTKVIDLSKKIKFRGKTFNSIRKLAKFYKVSSGTLAGKLSRGISVKNALGF